MPCIPIPGGFACTRGRQSRKPCQEPGCTTPHVALCDHPVKRVRAHREGCERGENCLCRAEEATCDRRMCAQHRNRVGPDRDYCGAHHRAAMVKQGKLL